MSLCYIPDEPVLRL